MKNELKKYIAKIHPIGDKLLEEFAQQWELISAYKKEVVTEINSIDKHLYFILEGVQKAFYVTDGKEYIIAFSYPFSFTCIPESFLTQKPSNYCWQCISDSKFLRISYENFFSYIESHPEFETMLRKKLINTLGGLVNRYHRLLALSMKDRFIDLMKNSPQLINMVPQKDISNYLKISPTNFSTLINTIKL